MNDSAEGKGAEGWSRRNFVRGLAVAGTAGLGGFRPGRADADPPPETTTLRLYENPVACLVPLYVAQELLHAEGFTDVRYLKYPDETQAQYDEALLSGQIDMTLTFAPTDILHIEAGKPLVILAGSHIGCIELVARHRIRSILELKGKTVAVSRRLRMSTSSSPCSWLTWDSTP